MTKLLVSILAVCGYGLIQVATGSIFVKHGLLTLYSIKHKCTFQKIFHSISIKVIKQIGVILIYTFSSSFFSFLKEEEWPVRMGHYFNCY